MGIGGAQEEVAGVVRGVGLRHQQVPVPGADEILRHVRQALVMEFEQLEIGIVVDQAEGVSRGILQEVAHVTVDLIGDGCGLRIAVGRPDLGDEELEGVSLGRQRDQLGPHVPAHLPAVDLEVVQPPLAPLPHSQVGQRH